jgi:hypothetical protein
MIATVCLAVQGALLAQNPPKHKPKHKPPHKPKNEITKIEKARATDHTAKQVLPDPKKSPGKHADNLSKNINHELNRESKDLNHLFQGKKKKK